MGASRFHSAAQCASRRQITFASLIASAYCPVPPLSPAFVSAKFPGGALDTRFVKRAWNTTQDAVRSNALSPGGLYLAASCSSHVDQAAFDATIAESARRSRRILQVLDRRAAPPDHPRLLAFPEGDYLTVTLCRALA
jgi:hypothetical protein